MNHVLKTKWARKKHEGSAVWGEYPRPSLVRRTWKSLNGLWEYAITGGKRPESYDGTILVPFSPETIESGVMRTLYPGEILWYHKMLSFPENWLTGGRILLHIEAVDEAAVLYVNGKKAGMHRGGYLPFTADLTSFCKSGSNELVLKVRDDTDTSFHSRGKQKLKPGGMYYTAQSGIWQSVWLEWIPEEGMDEVRVTANLNEASLALQFGTGNAKTPVPLTVTVFQSFQDQDLCRFLSEERSFSQHLEPERILAVKHFAAGERVVYSMKEVSAWSPEHPVLYGVLVRSEAEELLLYTAFRTAEIRKDRNGVLRIFLNGSCCLQTGLLDQGYWPESLYTAPCDAALIADVQMAKNMGFNLLRKHAKIEMQRYYYHCDRLGMLVWQDMVNGGDSYHPWFVTYAATVLEKTIRPRIQDRPRRLLSRKDAAGRREYIQEVRETIKHLDPHPCIICWVPFNEGWGQFEAEKITALIRQLDPTRLVDSASGWFDQGCGDIRSYHYYFFSFRFRTEKKRACAISEFGGYSLPIPGHAWSDQQYGYRMFANREKLEEALEKLWKSFMIRQAKKGICAFVYTQLSDIEEENNGLVTYDRKIIKTDPDKIRAWNLELKKLEQDL